MKLVGYSTFDIRYSHIQARFACLRCAAGGHCVHWRRPWAPRITLTNNKGDDISKYVCLTVKIDSLEKSLNLPIHKFLMHNNRVMSHHFLMIVVSYLRYTNIHILLKFQYSIT